MGPADGTGVLTTTSCPQMNSIDNKNAPNYARPIFTCQFGAGRFFFPLAPLSLGLGPWTVFFGAETAAVFYIDNQTIVTVPGLNTLNFITVPRNISVDLAVAGTVYLPQIFVSEPVERVVLATSQIVATVVMAVSSLVIVAFLRAV